MGGRNETTPVASVVYPGDAAPAVQFHCLRAFAPSGDDLPFQRLRYESGAPARRPCRLVHSRW